MNRSFQLAKSVIKYTKEICLIRCLGTSSRLLYQHIPQPYLFHKLNYSSTSLNQNSSNKATNTEYDDLFKKVVLEIRGHDSEVIKSYIQFILMTTLELDIDVTEVKALPKEMHRRTLLKSAHVHKKHRVQYEWRTYRKVIEIRHLTGSTLSTFLEYVERNLPEGIAMQVSKTQLVKLPDHLAREVATQPEEIDEATLKLMSHKTRSAKEPFKFPDPRSIEIDHYF